MPNSITVNIAKTAVISNDTMCTISSVQVTPESAASLLLPMMSQKYRYCPDTRIWYEFDGQKMAKRGYIDDIVFRTLFDLENSIGGELGAQIHRKRFIQSFINRTIISLQNCQEIFVSIDDDPDVLNTPAGIYNLNTGERFDHDINSLYRHITSVSPLDDEDGKNCLNYMNHLQLVCKGDPELVNWIEEISGYILTGHVFQHEFYGWFSGDFGDSTITGIWTHILGEYFSPTHDDEFLVSGKRKVRPTDYTGKRLITNWGLHRGRWNEELLNAIILGLPIEARYGRTTIQVKPACKLISLGVKTPLGSHCLNSDVVKNLRLMRFPLLPENACNWQRDLKPEAPYILHRMMKHAKKVLLARTIETPAIVHRQSQKGGDKS